MIHSMSGGILSDYGSYTFVKVTVDGESAPHWFISEFDLNEGDRVVVPTVAGEKCGTVVRVERNVSGQVAPVPVKRARRIVKVLD